jgi:hypothetical protein
MPYPMARESNDHHLTRGEGRRGSSPNLWRSGKGKLDVDRCGSGRAVVLGPAAGCFSCGVRRGRLSICLPARLPPCPHVASPEHRCRRARAPPPRASRGCRAALPRPSTRRRKRLGRASWWRKKEDAERPRWRREETGRKRKEKTTEDERKESERKRKNNLSIVLEIVIHNLYLLYYYRGMKIEYASYKQI